MKTRALGLALLASALALPALAQESGEAELAIEARVLEVAFERNQDRRLFHRALLEVVSVRAGDLAPGDRLSLDLIHPLDVPPDQSARLRLLRPGDLGRFRLKATARPECYIFADQSDPGAFELIEQGAGDFPPPRPMLLRPDERAAELSERARVFLGLDLALGGLTFLIAIVAAVMLTRSAPKPDEA